MNLPDAPIAHEGFFATHFFTVSDQDKSKDFYLRILGGKVIKPDNPCYIKLANTWLILNPGGGPTLDKPEALLETPSDLNRVNMASLICVSPTSGPATTMGRQRSALSYRAIRTITAGNGAATCVIPTATSSRSANTLKSPSTGSTTAASLASDKPEDVRNFLGLARAAIRSLVRHAMKSGDIRNGPRGK